MTSSNADHFDEACGIVPCPTPWGKWWQTVEEVTVLVDLQEGTKAKDVNVQAKLSSLDVCVRGVQIIKGDFPGNVISDETVWTIEDGRVLRILLVKAFRRQSDDSKQLCWKSLLVGQYEADFVTYDQMNQKLTLEKFQSENPGFNFGGAKLTGDYMDGGPSLPSS